MTDQHDEAAEEMSAFDRLDADVQKFVRENAMDLRAKDVEAYILYHGKRKAMRDFKNLIEDFRRDHPVFDPPKLQRRT